MRKLINRISSILDDESGETIVEVVVAFALLSIMLVVFAQGLAWATSTEMNASEKRKTADDSMIQLQNKLATEHQAAGSRITNKDPNNPDVTNHFPIKRCVYDVGDDTYVVYEVAE